MSPSGGTLAWSVMKILGNSHHKSDTQRVPGKNISWHSGVLSNRWASDQTAARTALKVRHHPTFAWFLPPDNHATKTSLFHLFIYLDLLVVRKDRSSSQSLYSSFPHIASLLITDRGPPDVYSTSVSCQRRCNIH